MAACSYSSIDMLFVLMLSMKLDFFCNNIISFLCISNRDGMDCTFCDWEISFILFYAFELLGLVTRLRRNWSFVYCFKYCNYYNKYMNINIKFSIRMMINLLVFFIKYWWNLSYKYLSYIYCSYCIFNLVYKCMLLIQN